MSKVKRAAAVATADIERAVKELDAGGSTLKVMKTFQKAMERRRLDLHSDAASAALLEKLVRTRAGCARLKSGLGVGSARAALCEWLCTAGAVGLYITYISPRW